MEGEGAMPLCKWEKLHVYASSLLTNYFHFLGAVALECVIICPVL